MSSKRSPVKRARKSPLQRAIVGLRRKLRLTQQAFAIQMGTSVRSIAGWETDTRPGTIALLRMEVLSQNHPELAAVFHAQLKQANETLGRKVNDVLDEHARWQAIQGHLKAFGQQADKLRDLGQDEIAQAIVDRLDALKKELAAAQQWSWRSR